MEYGPVRQICGDAISDCTALQELEASNLPVGLYSAFEKVPNDKIVRGRSGTDLSGISDFCRWSGELASNLALGSSKGRPSLSKGRDCYYNFVPSTELEYLNLAGSTIVQAITSHSGSAFYGHIRGHDRVPVSFGSFIDRITSLAKTVTGRSACPSEATEAHSTVTPVRDIPIDKVETNIDTTRREGQQALDNGALEGQLYLAQVPIFSKESVQETTLSPLMQDIEMPQLLETGRVSDINLWMSMTDSRSSTHYDPCHNLLCVVTGEKNVTLWPPSAAPYLYPLAINGEASNHSGVNFVQPDFKAHPLFRKALSVAQLVTLHPGDVLFIPEGWYHQVDNCGVTIAVNFWWPSKASLTLGTHMDAYFLRRILVNLVDQEKNCMLGERLVKQRKAQQVLPVTAADNTSSESLPGPKQVNGVLFLHSVEASQQVTSNNAKHEHMTKSVPYVQSGSNLRLKDLTALETYSLNCLVESLLRKVKGTPEVVSETSQSARQVHDRQASTRCNGSDFPDVHQDNSTEISSEGVSDNPQMDSIASVFSTSKALSLRRVLLVMTTQFPRMLETLMLTSLSPSAAEILTRKFEELDFSTDEGSQAAFYEKFYSVFKNPDAFMEVLLNGKEAFAAQALRNVLAQYLGIDV